MIFSFFLMHVAGNRKNHDLVGTLRFTHPTLYIVKRADKQIYEQYQYMTFRLGFVMTTEPCFSPDVHVARSNCTVSVPADWDVLSDSENLVPKIKICFSPSRLGCPFGPASPPDNSTTCFSPSRLGCPFGLLSIWPIGRINVSVPADWDVLSDGGIRYGGIVLFQSQPTGMSFRTPPFLSGYYKKGYIAKIQNLPLFCQKPSNFEGGSE